MRTLFVIWASILILLNLLVLLGAYSASLSQLCCSYPLPARDFSAYYTALWNLIHDASRVYMSTPVVAGEPTFYPTMEQFKYLPSFLVLISPLATLGYQQAITAFDAVQFLMLPAIGWLLYALLGARHPNWTFFVTALVLLFPSPWPGWSLSVPYFWLWKEGQTKVLETLLLLVSFYGGKKGLPALSGAFLALSFFDPRLGVLGLPGFVMYNEAKLKTALAWLVAVLAASNAFLLLPGMSSSFLQMITTTGLSTKPYPYLLIPTSAVLSIYVLDRRELLLPLRKLIATARGQQALPSP